MKRGTPTSFPGVRADQVLAHVEGRCARRTCPYCRADREANHRDQTIIHQLAESLRLLQGRNL